VLVHREWFLATDGREIAALLPLHINDLEFRVMECLLWNHFKQETSCKFFASLDKLHDFLPSVLSRDFAMLGCSSYLNVLSEAEKLNSPQPLTFIY